MKVTQSRDGELIDEVIRINEDGEPAVEIRNKKD